MTCILGMEYLGKVHIVCDSCASNLYNYSIISFPKLFKKNDLLIGYTGTFRYGQIIQYKTSFPDKQKIQTDFEYLSTTVVDTIRNALKNNGSVQTKDNIEESLCDCVIGYNGSIYVFQSDFSIIQYKNSIASVGCGSISAKSALMGLQLNRGLEKTDPKTLLEEALSIVTNFDCHVKEPFYYDCI